MTTFQYYSTFNPTKGELVLVEFTEKCDSFFDAKLIEYPYRGMMNYSDASKKRKVASWNKIVLINKLMVARVDEIDEKAQIANISIAYLDEYFDEKNLSPSDIQERLMIQFNENKLLESIIKSLCVVTNSNFSDIWTKLVHTIDAERRKFNDENNDEPILLWKYFSSNFNEKIDLWSTTSGINDEIKLCLQTLMSKKSDKSPQKITSTIKIISQQGVSYTKKLLEKCLTPLKYQFTFRYLAAPNFIFETSTSDTTPEDHHELIANLKIQIQHLGLTLVFIQAIPDEVARVSE
jgi:translation initiation factor 2 alpha subunit (eIF-2alpha)